MEFHEFCIDIDKSWINTTVSLYVRFDISGIDATIKKKKNRQYEYVNDNYHRSTVKMYQVYISDAERVFPSGWHIGDTHYHSSYTADQVEFGAPIEMTKKMARAMGVDWFFVTDHSYDLDDTVDSYLINDPQLPKWHQLITECSDMSTSDVSISHGQEVSIGNRASENVHLLVVGQKSFIAGKGDSAEKWFANKPDHRLVEMDSLSDKSTLKIAAHPWEKVPFLQRLLLNRGNWADDDFIDADISYLQIINGQGLAENKSHIKRFYSLLLSGKKYFMVAGNDAHGNFAFMRQIQIPFLKLMNRSEQVFGEYFTAFQYHENEPFAGFERRRIIISNGPFLDMTIRCGDMVHHIGESIYRSDPAVDIELYWEHILYSDHNDLSTIVIYHGEVGHAVTTYQIAPTDKSYKIQLQRDSFFSVMLSTKSGGLAVTNPIWVHVRSDKCHDLSS
jgi:hypothetical protein